MIHNREELNKALQTIFQTNDAVLRSGAAQKLYENKGISQIEVFNIWGGNTAIEDAPDELVCALAQFLHPHNKRLLQGWDTLFTDEVKNKSFKQKTDDEKTYPIIIKNAVLINHNHYLASIHISQLFKLQHQGLLRREADTQRETITKVVNGVKISYINVDYDQVFQIAKALKERKYFPDELKINIIDNGNALFEYDDNKKELIIRAGDLSVVDGNHRLLAIEAAMGEDPTIDLSFPVSITYYPIWKSQEMLIQQEKKRPINKALIKTFANTQENAVVAEIYRNNLLMPGLEITKEEYAAYNGYAHILYSDLADAVNLSYSQTEIAMKKDEVVENVVKAINLFAMNKSHFFFNESGSIRRRNLFIKKCGGLYYMIKTYQYAQKSTNASAVYLNIIENTDYDRYSYAFTHAGPNNLNQVQAIDRLIEEAAHA